MAETTAYTPNITATFDDYFTPSFAARKVEQLTDPSLIMARPGFLTRFVGSPSHVIQSPPYRTDSSGNQITPGSSTKKRRPIGHIDGTRISAIDIDDYALKEYTMASYALKIPFDESVLSDTPGNRMKIEWAYEDMSRILAEFLNAEILTEALNDFTYTSGGDHKGYMDNEDATGFGYESTYGFLCGKLAAGTYWNTDSADYNTDIKNMVTMFENQQGYSTVLTTLLMHNTLLEDITLWGTENGHNWETSPLGNGRSIANIHGVQVIGLNNVDGMASHTDKVVMLDNRVTPCNTYYYNKAIPGYTQYSDEAIVQTKVIEPKPEYGNKEVLYRFEFGTHLQMPKHLGIAEVY